MDLGPSGARFDTDQKSDREVISCLFPGRVDGREVWRFFNSVPGWKTPQRVPLRATFRAARAPVRRVTSHSKAFQDHQIQSLAGPANRSRNLVAQGAPILAHTTSAACLLSQVQDTPKECCWQVCTARACVDLAGCFSLVQTLVSIGAARTIGCRELGPISLQSPRPATHSRTRSWQSWLQTETIGAALASAASASPAQQGSHNDESPLSLARAPRPHHVPSFLAAEEHGLPRRSSPRASASTSTSPTPDRERWSGSPRRDIAWCGWTVPGEGSNGNPASMISRLMTASWAISRKWARGRSSFSITAIGSMTTASRRGPSRPEPRSLDSPPRPRGISTARV